MDEKYLQILENGLGEIDNIINARMADIIFVAEARATMEDKVAIFNADTEIKDKTDLMKREIRRYVKSKFDEIYMKP